ncbi:DUF3017 domain-containing protein [Streptomyces sp. JH34]|uniref:DUF3017 domain-containing protein n=1 Tax=Streptomyces sp. JH34 TaxID=2793633 RepID=UPI0023F890FD|nr:DUF3017 domain-containing protein [Streptomyces sp. JH34]MDF6019271.1 DUF3017 domain-containing protein [Streptomyces sp. JH34]
MGAGTSPADGRHADLARADDTQADDARADVSADAEGPGAVKASEGRRVSARPEEREGPGAAKGDASGEAGEADTPAPAGAPGTADPDGGAGSEGAADAGGDAGPDAAGAGPDGDAGETGAGGSTWAPSRRFSLTRDTARPEGGGRAAPGDAPAPARQWPLLTVLCTAGLGLLIVGADPFAQAFRIGTILMGVALLAGAVLRWVVPSVGMLAVRSRFTDLVTYGLMGTLIVLLALMAQPKPWLQVPILQDVVHFTIR